MSVNQSLTDQFPFDLFPQALRETSDKWCKPIQGLPQKVQCGFIEQLARQGKRQECPISRGLCISVASMRDQLEDFPPKLSCNHAASTSKQRSSHQENYDKTR